MRFKGYRQRGPLASFAPWLFFTACLLSTAFSVSAARAMNIQKIVSPKGIEAWLVEDKTLPLIAMQFGFPGGTSQDPANKIGVAHFVSGMLDEGAGDLASAAFQERLEELAIEFSFDASRDTFTGGIKTLRQNKDEAFRLLRLALTQPRMDGDAVERVREQILSGIQMDNEDPEKISANEWFKMVFSGHPYANPTKGTLESVRSITSEDLKAYVGRTFSRERVKIVAVGDITAAELSAALDSIFGDLPEKAQLSRVPEPEWRSAASSKVIPLAQPQSVVTFGQRGLKRKDPDFMAAFILNYILGGGGFSSTLMQEVREKRGLAYSVYSYLYPLEQTGILLGGVATRNEAVSQSIAVIREELGRIAANGPTAKELEDAKRYLTGSYALRFDSSVKIANTLLWLYIEDLGIDYVARRNSLIEAVTLDDVKRVAAKLFTPGDLTITIVGQPVGFVPDTTTAPPAATAAPRG